MPGAVLIPAHDEERILPDTLAALLGGLPAEAATARLLEVRVGPFWTVVHTTCGCGMASSMVRESDPHLGPPIAWAGELAQRSPLELTGLLRSASTAEPLPSARAMRQACSSSCTNR